MKNQYVQVKVLVLNIQDELGDYMKATIIKVSMIDGKGYDAMKPLLFAIMDSITPQNIEMEYFDERVEDLPKKIDSDIIALSTETFAARRA